MKILYQLAPDIKQTSTQSQWHAMVCIDPDWLQAHQPGQPFLRLWQARGSASFCRSEVVWVLWHHINFLWYRGNTFRQSSSHGHGRGRTSKTHKASEGLGWKLIMCHFHLILIGENKSCGKAQVWEVNAHWPGWDHSMVWMKGGVRNQG